MGFSISWLAVRGKDRAAILSTLRLAGTGEYEEIPESLFQAAELANGWYLVVADGCAYAEGEAPLDDLSKGGEIVTCSVEEHVMWSSATGWKNGKQIWSIVHDAQKNSDHLHAKGELPPVFAGVRDNLIRAQRNDSDVDYIFDIPVQVAEAITGFKYDQSVAEPGFEILEQLD
jgi:hypothetical protein